MNNSKITVREATERDIRGARITTHERDDGTSTVVEVDRNTVILSFAAAAVAGIVTAGGLFLQHMASSNASSEEKKEDKEQRKRNHQNAREVD